MDIYEVVKNLIDEWDPYGLLNINCPNDEYEYEIKEIVKNIYLESSINEIANKISQIFIKSFNEPDIFCIENCLNVSKLIKKKMEDNLFYYFVDYYKSNSKNDNHFEKFHLLFEKLKKDYESNIIDRIKVYNILMENISENDKWYTGCVQMIKRLKEWKNL